MSRNEDLLRAYISGETADLEPAQSRNEMYLRAMIDGTDSSELPAPQSRVENLLVGVLDKINAGGGGGSMKPFVIRPDAELVQTWEYDKLAVADEGYTIPAYTTSRTTVKSPETISNVPTLDLDNYHYYVTIQALGMPVYNDDSLSDGKCLFAGQVNTYEIVSFLENEYKDEIGANTLPLSDIFTNTVFNLSACMISGTTCQIQKANGIGAYFSISNCASLFGNTLKLYTPYLYIQGSSGNFTSTWWAKMTDIRYRYRFDLWRAARAGDITDGWSLSQESRNIIQAYLENRSL